MRAFTEGGLILQKQQRYRGHGFNPLAKYIEVEMVQHEDTPRAVVAFGRAKGADVDSIRSAMQVCGRL